MADDLREAHAANRNTNYNNINELPREDENENQLLPVEGENLVKLKKELGLIDADGNDFYTQFSVPMTDDSLFVNVSSASDTDSGGTPFDLPLTEDERILLEQCTIGSPSSFSSRADRCSIRSSQSLDQITDILIKDLGGTESGDLGHRQFDGWNGEGKGNKPKTPSTRGIITTKLSAANGELDSASTARSLHGDTNEIEQTENDPSSSRIESKALENKTEASPQAETTESEKHSEVCCNSSDSGSYSNKVSRSPSLGSESLPTSNDSGLVVKEAETPSHRYFVVVAIDFGTTFSGYAFAFTRGGDSIHMMRRWEGGDPGVSNQKTPTTLLLKPDGSFHSFGFGARDFYHDLEPIEAKKWMYFEKFKMSLHTDKVCENPVVDNICYLFPYHILICVLI